MKITVFTPASIPETDIEKIIDDEFLDLPPLKPFAEIGVNFLSALSKTILESPGIKNYPELVALAFWLRKANIVSIINSFISTTNDSEIIVPRGIAFHIAPSNVDSIFLYSWTLSLLAGNINIVRISQNSGDQLNLLLQILRSIFLDEKWKDIAVRNIVITYPREESINKFISLRSDVRVLWGGDETIAGIRVLPSKPATKDLQFADKFSYTVIKSSSYNGMDDAGKAKLAALFYNDAYWFDQMACSSPRFVVFAGGSGDSESASADFWKFLEKELSRKGKSDSIDVAMEKLVYMYESISKSDSASEREPLNKNKPAVLRVDKSEIMRFRDSCGGGFFFECFVAGLEELAGLVSRKDQTLAYSGFEKDELTEFAERVNGKGIDRIVPVGQALNFSPVWDGYSLLGELTKKVAIV